MTTAAPKSSVPRTRTRGVPSAPASTPQARDERRAREQLFHAGPTEVVDIYGYGSFPASDPPSSWAGAPRRPG